MNNLKWLFLPVLILAVLSGCKKDDDDDDDDDGVTMPKASTPVTDIDGNTYKTVEIGTQIWMAENLKVTRYQDGDSIAYVPQNNLWNINTTGAFCFYNDSSHYINKYGLMYNFYAGANSKNICPTGWHIPTMAEWNTLVEFLGGTGFAGEKLKAKTGWKVDIEEPNNNISGFTAVPGGRRTQNGDYGQQERYGYYWSSTSFDTNIGGLIRLDREEPIVTYPTTGIFKNYGLSCRCVKD